MNFSAPPPSPALHTDRYELTMIQGALRDGTAQRRCVFEMFARRLPGGRRFGVVAGTGRFLDALHSFRFTDDQLRFLHDRRVVDAATITFLRDYRFGGNISGYREGELYFPGSPILTVEGTFADAVILETIALSVFNYDCAVATAAARMSIAAGYRPLAEMGSRRAHESAAIAAARAAYIAGFSATSNLEAGFRWNIPTIGTAAHAWTLLHASEEEAFRAQVDALGPQTTLLVDTYDIRTGVETAIGVAGPDLGGVRIDSGDLPSVAAAVRALLDKNGATRTRITVTSDLDEHAIATLAASPVDVYGVGTAVVTGSGHPAAGLVFKLVSRQRASGEWIGVVKASANKPSVGGFKIAHRTRDDAGVATAERLTIAQHPDGIFVGNDGENARSLQITFVNNGEVDGAALGPNGVTEARAHHQRVRAELPIPALALSRSDPAIPTVLAGSDHRTRDS